MSYEGSGVMAACGAAVLGVAAVGAIVVAGAAIGTCLLVGKGLQVCAKGVKSAVEHEIERRRQEEERRRREMRESIQAINSVMESLYQGATEVTVIPAVSTVAAQSIPVTTLKKQFLIDRLNVLQQKRQETEALSPSLEDRESLLTGYTAQIEQTRNLVKIAELEDKARENWLKRSEDFLQKLRSDSSPAALAESRSEITASLEPQSLDHQQLDEDFAPLQIAYETLITDSLIGAFISVDPDGQKMRDDIRQIRRLIELGKYEDARQLMAVSKSLPEKLIDKFSSHYANVWAQYVSSTVREVLESMGYSRSLKTTVRGNRLNVIGFDNITHLNFEYDKETGAVKFDLGHDAFEDQKACTAVAKRFIEEMTQRGILIQEQNFRLTHALDNQVVQESTLQFGEVELDRIIHDLQDQGWGARVYEEGDHLTLVVSRGYFEDSIEFKKEQGLEPVRQMVQKLKERTHASTSKN